MPKLDPEKLAKFEGALNKTDPRVKVQPNATRKEALATLTADQPVAIYGTVPQVPKRQSTPQREQYSAAWLAKDANGEVVEGSIRVDLSKSEPAFSQPRPSNPKRYNPIKNIKAFFSNLIKKLKKPKKAEVVSATHQPVYAASPISTPSVGAYGTLPPNIQKRQSTDYNSPPPVKPSDEYGSAPPPHQTDNTYSAAPPPAQRSLSMEDVTAIGKVHGDTANKESSYQDLSVFAIMPAALQVLEKEYKVKFPEAKNISVSIKDATKDKPPKFVFHIEIDNTLRKRLFTGNELKELVNPGVAPKSLSTSSASLFSAKPSQPRAMPLNPDQLQTAKLGLEALEKLYPKVKITSHPQIKNGKIEYAYSIQLHANIKPLSRTFTEESMKAFLEKPTFGEAPPVTPRRPPPTK